MGAHRRTVVTASLVLLVGLVLVVREVVDPEAQTGWFAYAPLSEDPMQGPVLLTPLMMAGGVLVWVASLVICGVLVHRRATAPADGPT